MYTTQSQFGFMGPLLLPQIRGSPLMADTGAHAVRNQVSRLVYESGKNSPELPIGRAVE